jgi:glycosidase
MGENLAIEGRLAVRSPMQWSAAPNGGFSAAEDPADLCRPVVATEGFGPGAVNAADQRRDPESLMSWFERLIRRRKECPELGWGTFRQLDPGSPAVFAHRCDWDASTVVALHNLSGEPQDAAVTLEDHDGVSGVVDLFAPDDPVIGSGGRLELRLAPYGFRWLRLVRPGRPPAL